MTYPTIDSFAESGLQTISATNMLDVIGSVYYKYMNKKVKRFTKQKIKLKKN